MSDQPTDESYQNEESDEDLLSFHSGSEDHDRFSSPDGAGQEHNDNEHRTNEFNTMTPQHVLMIDTSFRSHRHHHHDEDPGDDDGGGGDSASDSFYTPTGGDASIPSFTTAGAPSDETSFLGSVDFLGEDECSLEGGGESSMEQTGLSTEQASPLVDLLRAASVETREEEGEDGPPSLMQPETPRASNTARRLFIQQKDPNEKSNEVMSDGESLPVDEMLETVHTSNLVDRTTLLALPETLFVGSLGDDEQESSIEASHDNNVGDTVQMNVPPKVSRVTDQPADEVNDDSVVRVSDTENAKDIDKLPWTGAMLTMRDTKGNINSSTKDYLDAVDQNSESHSEHPDGIDGDEEDGSSSAELVGVELSNANKIHSEAIQHAIEHESHLIWNDDASVEVSLGVPSEASMDLSTNPSADSLPADGGIQSDGNEFPTVPEDTASVPRDSVTEILYPSVRGNASEESMKMGGAIPPVSLTGGDGNAGDIDDFEHLLAKAEHDFLSMLDMDASARSMLGSAVAETHSEREEGSTEAAILPLDSSGGNQPSSLVAQSSAHSRSSDAHFETIERSETEESTGSNASIRAVLQKELHELGLTPNSDLDSPDTKPMPVASADSDTIIPDNNYQNSPTVDGPSLVAGAEKNPNDVQLAAEGSDAPHSPKQTVDSAHERSEAARSPENAAPPGSLHETAETKPPVDVLLHRTTHSVSSPENQEVEETARTSQFQILEEAQDSNIDAVLTNESPGQHNSKDYSPGREPTLLSSQVEYLVKAAESKSDHEVEVRDIAVGQFAEEKPQALVLDAPGTEQLENSNNLKQPDGQRNPTVESKDMTETDEETQSGGGSLSNRLSSIDETLASEKTSNHSVGPDEPKPESSDGHIGHTRTPLDTETAKKAKENDVSQRISPTETASNTDLEITSQKRTDEERLQVATLKLPLPDDVLETETEALGKYQNDEEPSDDFGDSDNLEREDDEWMQVGPIPGTESTVQATGRRIQPLKEPKSPAVDGEPNTAVSKGPERRNQPETGRIKGDVVSMGTVDNSGGVEPKHEIDIGGNTPAGSLSKGPSTYETLVSEKTSEQSDGNKGHAKENDVVKEEEVDTAALAPTGLESNADYEVVSPKETEEAQAVATLKSPLGETIKEMLEESNSHRKLEAGVEAFNTSGETENVEGQGELDTHSGHKVEVLTKMSDEGHQLTDKPRIKIVDADAAEDTDPKSLDAESTMNKEDSVKSSEKRGGVKPRSEIGILSVNDAVKVHLSEGLKEVQCGKMGENSNFSNKIDATEDKREDNHSNYDQIRQPFGIEKHSLARAAGVEDDTTTKQKLRIESKPPLFPKKAKELYENPDSFVEFLSNKLVAQVSSKEGTPEGNEDTSPQLKRSAFDPEKSVFANFAGDWESLELSPPGSPPEPSFEESDDDGSSLEGSQESNSNLLPRLVHPEAATWDLVSEPISVAASFGLDESLSRHPDYVMMPDGARTPPSSDAMISPSMARSDSLPSDVGVLSRQRSQRISFGETSLSSSQHKRMEPSAGLLSVSHRTLRKHPLSARASKQKNRVKWARRSRFPGLAFARSEELRTMNSPDADDPDETVSLGAKLLRDEIFRNLPGKQVDREGLLLKSVSSPDLSSTRVAAALRLERGEDAVANMDIFRAERPALIRQWKSFEMPRVENPNLSVRSPERQINNESSQEGSPKRSTANEGNLILLGHLGHDVSSDQEESMLHEELLTFTTLEPIDFPFQFSIQDDSIRYCGSLCWQQLLSCWRHDQLIKSLTKDTISQPLTQEELDLYKEDDIESSHGRVKNESIEFLELNGMRLFPDGALRSAISEGNTRSEALALSILRTLSSRSPDKEKSPLRHVIQSLDETTVQKVLLAAESNLGIFTALIKSIVGFACYELLGEMGSVIDFTVCKKTSEDILKKAKRKYDGDILQVKDIIRGSIIFPTVGSLLCGLIFLAKICSESDCWEAGDRRVRLEVVRVKNLFASSSSMGGFDRSPLPTGYRHVLLNIRLDGGVLAEIQCHLSGMYDILGETGHILHHDLTNLIEACGGKLGDFFETYEKLLRNIIIGHRSYCGSSPLPHVKNDPSNEGKQEMEKEKTTRHGNAMSISSSDMSSREEDPEGETPKPVVGDPKLIASVGSTLPKDPDDETIPTQNDVTTPPRLRVEENDKVIPVPLHGKGDRSSTLPKQPASSPVPTKLDFDQKLSELETPIAGRSNRNPDQVEEGHVVNPIPWAILSPITRDGLSRVAKYKLLEDLQSMDEAPTPESIILAILECATSAASENPRDLASFFCLHMLFISFLRDAKISSPKTKDGPIKEAELFEYSRRCLLRCFMLCCQATSLGMTGWLEYGENDPIVRLEEGPANMLNLIADSFAQELKWREAQTVLQSLFLKYERELPSYHPLRIESIFNLASVAFVNGNASFAAKLISKATDAVSRRLVELESSILSFTQSYSSSNPRNMPLFRAEGLGSALVALGWYVSYLQEVTETMVSTHHYNSSGVIFMQQSLVADGFAVLANCKAAVRAKLGSRSSGETVSGRYYWKLALTYYHKAFKGLSASKGFEDHHVCGAAFGMARCLRELGEHQKALELLSTVVAALETTPASPIASKAAIQPLSLQHFGGEKKRDPFLSQVLRLQSRAQGGEPQIQHHVTVALCLWQMSVLSVDGSPDEKGRTRAFGLLHAASVSMQLALRELSDTDGMIQTTCIDILGKIENEAKKISKPLRRLQ